MTVDCVPIHSEPAPLLLGLILLITAANLVILLWRNH